MRKIILLIFFGLIVSINANDIFMDITLGKSIGSRYSQYKYTDSGRGSGFSSEGDTFKGDLRVGYSMPTVKNFLIEPSIGWGVLNGAGVFVNGLYNIELPILYKYKIVKFGAFTRYNYLSGISVNDFSKSIKVEDKTIYSVGLKLVFDMRNVNFLISYEYLPNAVYEDTVIKGSEYTYTKVDIEGGYLSFGARIKF